MGICDYRGAKIKLVLKSCGIIVLNLLYINIIEENRA
jgi:hypothetical protein